MHLSPGFLQRCVNVLQGFKLKGMIYLFGLSFGIVAGFAIPAENSIVPMLVDEQDLQAGNSVMMGIIQLAGFVGPTLAGILIAPITFTAWDVGVMLGLKGFAAAILGGLGSGPGAVLGGLTLGLLEALSAGYVSSAYKDVIAFGIMLAVLVLMPGGLLGRRSAERV